MTETNDLIENILQALNAEENPREICKKFKTTLINVRAVARLYEIEIPKTLGKAKTDYPVEDWINAYADGKTLKEIASEHNCSYATVRNRLISNGVKLVAGRPSHMDKFDKEEVEQMYHEEGLTLQVLATNLDTSILTLRKFMLQNKIELRNPGTRAKIAEPVLEEEIQIQGDLSEDPMEMLELLTMKELRELCAKQGIEVNGTKDEMCERLQASK